MRNLEQEGRTAMEKNFDDDRRTLRCTTVPCSVLTNQSIKKAFVKFYQN